MLPQGSQDLLPKHRKLIKYESAKEACLTAEAGGSFFMPSNNFTVLLSFVRKGKTHHLILTKWKNPHSTALWQWLCIVAVAPRLLL